MKRSSFRPSVRPSIRLSHRSATAAAGLLLSALWELETLISVNQISSYSSNQGGS